MSERNKRGQFKKGVSGNPAGKPKGLRSKASALAEQLFRGQLDDIVKATIEAALEGDTGAQRLILERICPVRRGATFTIDDLPDVKTLPDVHTALTAIIRKMTDGEISAEEAMSIGAVVEMQRRAIETIDLEKRIAALEGAS